MKLNNFTLIESTYGKLIINRHCAFQAEHLIKLGTPHIQAELNNILGIVNTLPEGCIIVDAGANAGLIAVPMAQTIKARRGSVHAFEIQRMLFYALCGSAALNDLDNLFVYQKGLGASRGELTVPLLDYGQPQDLGLFSLIPGNEKFVRIDEKSPREKIEIIPIDELKLPRLDFLKIDVEGMELQVLDGAKQTIQSSRPWCWIEYWAVQIDVIKTHFAGLPYTFYVMDDQNLLCAPAERLEGSQIKTNAKAV